MKKTEELLKPIGEPGFARQMAKMTGRSIDQCASEIRDFLNCFAYLVRNEQPVIFKGFFQTRFVEMEEKTMHSYMDDKDYTIPAHKRLIFRASKGLYKDTVQRVAVDTDTVDQFI